MSKKRVFRQRGKVSVLSETGNIFLKGCKKGGTTLQPTASEIGPNL